LDESRQTTAQRDRLAELEHELARLRHQAEQERRYRGEQFETLLTEIMSWRGFEVVFPKIRKNIITILKTISEWPH